MAFSIDKKKFSQRAFKSLKKKLDIIRKIVSNLRSINYYLETIFLEDLRLAKIKINSKDAKLRQIGLVRNEVDALEYITYKLIEEAVALDKRLLKEYKHKEKEVVEEEEIRLKGIEWLLKKESIVLEHLEAKLPPPKAATATLLKEPTFSHWVARIFALLSYFEHMHYTESNIFNNLKKNKTARIKINKKIVHIIKERAKLLKIMQEKAVSMRKFTGKGLKEELHKLAASITL